MNNLPSPDELDRYAGAIDSLLRGAGNRTLRPKDVEHLRANVAAGAEALRLWSEWRREKAKAAADKG